MDKINKTKALLLRHRVVVVFIMGLLAYLAILSFIHDKTAIAEAKQEALKQEQLAQIEANKDPLDKLLEENEQINIEITEQFKQQREINSMIAKLQAQQERSYQKVVELEGRKIEIRNEMIKEANNTNK